MVDNCEVLGGIVGQVSWRIRYVGSQPHDERLVPIDSHSCSTAKYVYGLFIVSPVIITACAFVCFVIDFISVRSAGVRPVALCAARQSL